MYKNKVLTMQTKEINVEEIFLRRSDVKPYFNSMKATNINDLLETRWGKQCRKDKTLLYESKFLYPLTNKLRTFYNFALLSEYFEVAKEAMSQIKMIEGEDVQKETYFHRK